MREALKLAGREDLVGTAPGCLVRPAFGQSAPAQYSDRRKKGAPARRPTLGTAAAAKKAKPTKLDRVFGKDSARIKREADKMSSQYGTKPKKDKLTVKKSTKKR